MRPYVWRLSQIPSLWAATPSSEQCMVNSSYLCWRKGKINVNTFNRPRELFWLSLTFYFCKLLTYSFSYIQFTSPLITGATFQGSQWGHLRCPSYRICVYYSTILKILGVGGVVAVVSSRDIMRVFLNLKLKLWLTALSSYGSSRMGGKQNTGASNQ